MGGDTNLDGSPDQTGEYEVRVMDNDHNTYQQVMDITMLALDLTEEQAYAVAWEVDHKGSCVVAIGPRDEAESVASIIRTIGIEVQVNLVAAGTA
jgi:ATP-dependent Clp protease adapter protein ClpS